MILTVRLAIFASLFLLCSSAPLHESPGRIHPVETAFEPVESYDVTAGSSDVVSNVGFLSDAVCQGRGPGSVGCGVAGMHVGKWFSSCGLVTWSEGFVHNSILGRNVVGECRREGASRWIIVMAHLDSVGDKGQTRLPGADSNASGLAALMELSRILPCHLGRVNLLFAAVDGHCNEFSGAAVLMQSLRERGIFGNNIKMVVNLDIVGSSLSPPQKFWKDYLIALGGSKYSSSMESCNSGLGLHLYYDYYGSRSFTDLFYRKISDHRPFLEAGVPCVMFTSGITMNTNLPSDTPRTLDFPLLERRIEFILRWLLSMSASK